MMKTLIALTLLLAACSSAAEENQAVEDAGSLCYGTFPVAGRVCNSTGIFVSPVQGPEGSKDEEKGYQQCACEPHTECLTFADGAENVIACAELKQ